LSGGQIVTVREGKSDYEEGFLFTANNGIVIEAVYDTTKEQITLSKVVD